MPRLDRWTQNKSCTCAWDYKPPITCYRLPTTLLAMFLCSFCHTKYFRSVLTSLCLCGWIDVGVFIITLSINSSKMYLLKSLYKQQKLLSTDELHAEHRTGCVPVRNEESQIWGMCNLAFMFLLLKCKNKVTIYFSFKGPFWFFYNFVSWNAFVLKKTRLTLKQGRMFVKHLKESLSNYIVAVVY